MRAKVRVTPWHVGASMVLATVALGLGEVGVGVACSSAQPVPLAPTFAEAKDLETRLEEESAVYKTEFKARLRVLILRACAGLVDADLRTCALEQSAAVLTEPWPRRDWLGLQRQKLTHAQGLLEQAKACQGQADEACTARRRDEAAGELASVRLELDSALATRAAASASPPAGPPPSSRPAPSGLLLLPIGPR